MISTLRIVLGSMRCSDAVDKQYVNLLALAFVDGIPSDFKGPISGPMKSFETSVRKDLGGEGLAKDDPDRMHKLRGMKGMESATRDSWGVLRDVRMLRPSKWYKDDIGYRSFLLVKAFVEGFRVLRNRIGAGIPALDDLWKVSNEDVDGGIRKLYNTAYDKFRMVPIFKSESKKEVPKNESKKEVSRPDKDVPIDQDVKKTLQRLDKTLHDFKTKVMPVEDQERLHKLMEQVLSLMTARPEKSVVSPVVKSAGIDDALSRLVKFIRPSLGNFLKRIREEKVDVPAEELIWRDPDRLRAVLEDMEPEHLRRVMEQTEKILGMLAYS